MSHPNSIFILPQQFLILLCLASKSRVFFDSKMMPNYNNLQSNCIYESETFFNFIIFSKTEFGIVLYQRRVSNMDYHIVISCFALLSFLVANILGWLILRLILQVYRLFHTSLKKHSQIRYYAKGYLNKVSFSAAIFKQYEFSSQKIEKMANKFGFNLYQAKQV